MTWSQITNGVLASPTFSDWYSPPGTNTQCAGVQYQGVVSVATGDSDFPADYRTNMRMVTVTLYWTNAGLGAAPPVVRSRQMQTSVARYGMQNYIY